MTTQDVPVVLENEVEEDIAKISRGDALDMVHIIALLMNGDTVIERPYRIDDRVADLRNDILKQGDIRRFRLINGTEELFDGQYLKDLNLPERVTLWVVIQHERDHFEQKELSIEICGHYLSGRGTITSRLEFELGGISDCAMEYLKREADRVGQGSQLFAFYVQCKEEDRSRPTKHVPPPPQFFTEKWHYTCHDTSRQIGSRDFVKHMISGQSRTDVGLIMVPADASFQNSIAKGDLKAGEPQGQARQHARLLNLLGVKQIVICVNKMDCDDASYTEARFDKIKNETKSMLVKVGWKKDHVEKSVPIVPISAWMGDNLLSKSENMPWWKGTDVHVGREIIHVDTVYDCLDRFCRTPQMMSPINGPMQMPISLALRPRGARHVMLAGRVEQGILECGEEVLFLPGHTPSNPCNGKVVTMEIADTQKSHAMRQRDCADETNRRVDFCIPGDDVRLQIEGLTDKNMPHIGAVMVCKKDAAFGQTIEFDARIQTLDIHHEIKVGYSPIVFGRCCRTACRITKLKWKMGKETGGKRMLDPHSLKRNEIAECSFQALDVLVCDTFERCELFSRVAFFDGTGTNVMIGKIVSCVAEDERVGDGDSCLLVK